MIKNIAAIILGGVSSIMTVATITVGIKLSNVQKQLDTAQEALVSSQTQLDALQNNIDNIQSNDVPDAAPTDIIRLVNGMVQIAENGMWTDYCTLNEFEESDIVTIGIKKMENIVAENKKDSIESPDGFSLTNTANSLLDVSTAVIAVNNKNTAPAIPAAKPSAPVPQPTQSETQAPQPEPTQPETQAPAPQPEPEPTQSETPAPQPEPTQSETQAPTPTEPETPAPKPTQPEAPAPTPTEPETEAPTSSGDGEDIGWTDDIL